MSILISFDLVTKEYLIHGKGLKSYYKLNPLYDNPKPAFLF